jgi:GNAT superfamily N-acetyltransferase
MLLFSSVRKAPLELMFQQLSLIQSNIFDATIIEWIKKEWGQSSGSIETYLKSQRDSFYIATDNEELVALFALLDFQDEDIKPQKSSHILVRELDYVYVNKKYRGRGVLKEILKHAEKIERERGARQLILETLTEKLSRTYARHFNARFLTYNKCGLLRSDILVKDFHKEENSSDSSCKF